MDAANLLKPALARGELRCIGATTLDEYREHIEKDPALERRFQPVFVGEPSVEDTIAILRGLKERYEVHHKVKIQDSALVAAAKLASRYITDRFLPDKAIDLVDEASQPPGDGAAIGPDRDRRHPAPAPPAATRPADARRTRTRSTPANAWPRSRPRSRSVEKELQDLRRQWEFEKSGLGDVQKVRERLAERPGANTNAACDRDPPDRSSAASGPTRRSTRPWPTLDAERKDLEQKIAQAEAAGDSQPQGRPPAPEEGGRLRGDRRGRQPVDRHPGRQDADHRARQAGQAGGPDPPPDGRTRTRPSRPWPTRSAGAARASRTRTGRSARSCSSARPASARPSWPRPWPSSSSTARRRWSGIDMSEFGERHNVARLIGAPPGYVGYEEGGRLTEAIRRRPYSVVLLDEVEKAHRDVFNVLLQVLDDGRLTDGQGRTVDFRNTVIIMTCNLGSQEIARLAGTGDEDRLRQAVMQVLKAEFLPEFLNRIDETIIFHPLGMAELAQIVEFQLRRLQVQLAEANLKLQISDEAKLRLAEEGFDPAYGARPLKRVIQQRLANPSRRRYWRARSMRATPSRSAGTATNSP